MKKNPRQLTLPACIGNLEAIQAFITACAQAHSLPEDRIFKLQLASEEALMNIFSYAYPDDAPGEVTVLCTMENARDFLVSFEDRGQAFDLLSVADPDTGQSLDERSVGGLGIHFIKKMTDAVWYARKDGKNILTFRITIP